MTDPDRFRAVHRAITDPGSITARAHLPGPDDRWESLAHWQARAVLEVTGSWQVRESTHWCVWFGGEDPNDCAGRLEYDDEAECAEMTQWISGGRVASRTVIYGKWEDAKEGEH